METVTDIILGGSKITADGEWSHEIRRYLLLGRKAVTNLDRILKNRLYFADNGESNQSYGFSGSHVRMWEMDYKEIWASKNWYFSGVGEDPDNPLDCKEIQSVNPQGNKSWIFTGRTDAKAEAPILWPPDMNNWFIGKDPDAGKDWRQEEKEMTEDAMAGIHHRLDGHEFEQDLGVGDG